jgi:hypothetical protein
MSKHTKGPWVAVERQRKLWVLTNPDSKPFTGQVIAQQTTCPDWEANARLIAAAPELLATCEQARLWVALQGEVPGCGPAARAMLAVLDAAIAKAEGNA